MSPRTKIWTERTLLTAVAAVGGGLATAIPLASADPDRWFAWIERVGLPTAALVAITFLIVIGVRTVWLFFEPHLAGVFASLRSLIERQSAFVEKCDQTQDELKSMLVGGQERDLGMVEILERIDRRTEDIDKRTGAIDRRTEDTHRKIGEINSRVGGGR